LPRVSPERISRLVERLRIHGLIKKSGCRDEYYLITLGRRVATTALRISELVVTPSLDHEPGN
jgi:hypothetical protein